MSDQQEHPPVDERDKDGDEVDERSAESFPSSDPPSTWAGDDEGGDDEADG